MSSAHQPGPLMYNANNELTAWGSGSESHAIQYDPNGSTIKDELGVPVSKTIEYVYDAQDRLTEVRDNKVAIAKYAYDPMGRRIRRETFGAGASTTWFLFAREGLIGEYSHGGALVREYGWKPRGMWGTDLVFQSDSDGTISLVHNDHLFTSEKLTKATDGAVSWSVTREAFGKVSVRTGSTTEHLLRFPGQWEDHIAGVKQNYFRDYQAQTGRYLVRDRVGLGGGFNVFHYSKNPISRFDRLGLQAQGPNFDDQCTDDPENDRLRDYQDFFNVRFPRLIEFAKREFDRRIKHSVCSRLPSTPPSVKGMKSGVDDIDYDSDYAKKGRERGEARYMDDPQGLYQRVAELGDFELKTGMIFLRWNNENQCPRVHCFGYSTTMYVWENAGDDLVGLLNSNCFERKMVLAQWPLTGGHCCDR
jgi:RHS repeat-associated protein